MRSTAPLAEVLITPELALRPAVAFEMQLKAHLMRMLSVNMDKGVQALLQAVVDWTLLVTPSVTVGLSVVHKLIGGELLTWAAMTGEHAAMAGSKMPLNHSICGYALAQGTSQLFADPARHFTDLQWLAPPVFEVLVTPIYDHGNRPYGAVLVFGDQDWPPLSARDVQFLEFLAEHLVVACEMASVRAKA